MLMKIKPLHREAWQRVLFSSSILPLNPQVDFESDRERWEKRAKGGRERGLFLFLFFFFCTSVPAYFFSQAGLKSRTLEPNILAI